MEQSTKNTWSKPSLTSYGSVEDITATKEFGFSDFLVIIKGPFGPSNPGPSTGS